MRRPGRWFAPGFARTALLMVGVAAVGYWLARRHERRKPLVRGPVTQTLVPVQPAGTDVGRPGWNLEQRLDEALKETFPASDPIAIVIE